MTSASKLAEVLIQDLINKTVEIESYQATYLVIKTDLQTIRFDLDDKKEFKLKKGTAGLLQYVEKHPLLLDYNEALVTTYINSKADNFKLLSNNIKTAIEACTLGWRNWTEYVTDKRINFTVESFEQNLKSGSGKILEAPLTITQQVVAVCNQHQVKTTSFSSIVKAASYKLLLIEQDYVIARNLKHIP